MSKRRLCQGKLGHSKPGQSPLASGEHDDLEEQGGSGIEHFAWRQSDWRDNRHPEGPNDEQSVLRVRKINPKTHAFDDAGIALSPAHVFCTLRRIAGIADDKVLSPFPINIEGGELELAV